MHRSGGASAAFGARRRGFRPARIWRWFAFLALLRLGVLCASLSADLHVSPAGSDAEPGTETRPLATLEAARDAVRKLRREGALPPDGLTVWLHRGDYTRTRALDLDAADSGTETARITWRAVDGDAVRLLGGRRLTGFVPVSESAVLERLDPAARGAVLRCDLRALGITDYGVMRSRGFGRPTVPAHPELFFERRPMTLARWPNEGAFEHIAGFPVGTGRGDDHGGQIGDLPAGFVYAGDRPRRWKEFSEVWVHGYWAWDWANSYERVIGMDLDQRLLKTAPPHGLYGFRKGQRFYFLNILEELDQPGEWYLDRAHGQLYFWPPSPIESAEVLLSLMDEPFVRAREVSYVTIRGVLLEATRSSGVEIRGGKGDRLEACVIRNVGNHGVDVDGGQDHGVIACDISDTGDGGVLLTGGDRQTLTPGRHFVENCRFTRQGRWTKCYVPAVHLQGVGLRASHNLIQDHPHCGILFWGNDHLIEFNEIHHIALETGDVGAIYTGRDFTFRGNRIRNNFIHHTGGVGMGSMGVYMDDCVSGTEIAGNIFYRVQRAAFLGGGRDHQVTNNIFVECNSAVELDGRGLDRSPVWRGMVNETMRKSLGAVPTGLYRERYPALRDLDPYYGPPDGRAIEGDAFKGVPPENNVVARNVCVGKWLHTYWNAREDQLRLTDNVVGDLREFARPITDASTATDFVLSPGSRAWSSGFQRIPVDQIGLRDDPLRREISRHSSR